MSYWNKTAYFSSKEKLPNLFDETTLLPAQGFVLQSDGSYKVEGAAYISKDNVYNQRIMWINDDGISGQLTFAFDTKYSDSNDVGIYPYIYYTDGTTQSFSAIVGNVTDKTVFNRHVFTTPANKTVSRIVYTYNINKVTWFKDIMLEIGETDGTYIPY